MHLFLEIISSSNNEVMAFSEQLLLNVNLKKRKTENYPEWALKRLSQLKKDHKEIKFPKNKAFKISLFVPYQAPLKLGLSANIMALPFPTGLTTREAEGFK